MKVTHNASSNNIRVPLAASLAAFFGITAVSVFVYKKNKRQGTTTNKQFLLPSSEGTVQDEDSSSEDEEERNTSTSAEDDTTEQPSSRLVRYLSGMSNWSEYNDDDEFFIQDLPKVELHVHLDGTFDADFLWDYMQQHPESIYCLPVSSQPPWEDPAKELKIRDMVEKCQTNQDFHELCTCRGYRSLKEMLNCFEVFLPLVRGNLELLEQLAFDFCQRQYEQNVVYAEVRYSPHLFAEGFDDKKEEAKSTITAEAVYLAVTKGLRRGCQEFDTLTVNQILCAICWRPDWAISTVELAAKYLNKGLCAVVGVDIAAGEEHFDKRNFKGLYESHYQMAQLAQKKRIPLTIHAGEATSLALDNVRRSITEYGASRIGHGYRMVQSADVMKLVREKNVHVEVCPTSSVETGGWVYANDDRDWRQHPIKTMMEHGVSVSLSSDDPAVFHTSLAWQYRIAMAKMELSREDLVRFNLEAIDAAFCSDAEKQKIRKLIQCFGKEMDIDGFDHHCVDNPRDYGRSKTDSFSDRVYLNSEEKV